MGYLSTNFRTPSIEIGRCSSCELKWSDIGQDTASQVLLQEALDMISWSWWSWYGGRDSLHETVYHSNIFVPNFLLNPKYLWMEKILIIGKPQNSISIRWAWEEHPRMGFRRDCFSVVVVVAVLFCLSHLLVKPPHDNRPVSCFSVEISRANSILVRWTYTSSIVFFFHHKTVSRDSTEFQGGICGKTLWHI